MKAREKSNGPALPWRPRTSEYDLTALLLAQLVDITSVIAAGKRLKKVEPIPVPLTAREAIEAEQSWDSSMWLIAQLTPHALKK